jgi:hypothetical protein
MVFNMSNKDSKVNESGVAVTYSEAAWKRAYVKYSFSFTIGGEAHRTWYNPDTERTYTDCGDKAEALYEAALKIDLLLQESSLKAQIYIIDLYNFVCKHSRAMIKVMQVLQRAPASEVRHEPLSSDADIRLKEFLEVSRDKEKTVH